MTPKGSDDGVELTLPRVYQTPRPSYSEKDLTGMVDAIDEKMVKITEETEEDTLLKSQDIL